MDECTDLSGRVCVVAGGGRGVGAAAARGLAEEGATVVVSDLGCDLAGEGRDPEPARSVAAAIRDEGGTATADARDVAELDAAAALIRETVEEHGRVDAVCNFANVLRDGYATNLTAADWDEVMRVNARANFALLRPAARHWRSVADGEPLDPQRSFLAATSESALGNVGQLNYATAKAGVLGFVRAASSELHSTGVRVNALIPAGYTRATETVPEELRPYTPEEMPAEKVGPMVAYLAGDAATDVTGVTFYAGNDRVAVYSDPEPVRQAVRPGGWSAAELAASMDDVTEGVDLTRTERFI